MQYKNLPILFFYLNFKSLTDIFFFSCPCILPLFRSLFLCMSIYVCLLACIYYMCIYHHNTFLTIAIDFVRWCRSHTYISPVCIVFQLNYKQNSYRLLIVDIIFTCKQTPKCEWKQQQSLNSSSKNQQTGYWASCCCWF